MAGQHHHIAVVGAGPRGTSLLERLCVNAAELCPGQRLTVHVIDPYPPGAGQVWRTAQSGELLMNTVASQVTLFTDASVSCEGPVRPGPSLYEWAAARALPLAPDDYPPRALYGRYLEWFHARAAAGAPDGVEVVHHAILAVRLRELPGGAQELELADGTRLGPLDAVALAQGHLPERLDAGQRALAAHAAAHGLRHLPPANPADVRDELDRVAPGEPVLLRGLGLNFFDHVALLTSGRGGAFRPGADGGLVYVPSGREPRLYAGSRRGVPYHARGDNEKGAHGRHAPLLLTAEVIERFRTRAVAGDPPDFRAEVWPLVAKEAETVHYAAALAAAGASDAEVDAFRAAFPRTPHGSPAEDAVLTAAGFGPERRWDWERVQRPYGTRRFTDRADFRGWLLGLLREDVAQARLGNVAGPVKAALDVLRDLRNELRQIVDHGGLRADSRRDHLDRWYTPLNAFLSIGPPRSRIEELAALVSAGVVEILGPGLRVSAGHGPDGRPAFLADSAAVPGPPVAVRTLVEARLPEPDLRRTADPLLAALLAAGDCRPHRNGGYETGGVDVTPRPYRLIGRDGRVHPRRYALGVPTEGVHWVTAAGARPGVDSVTLSDTDAVARALLLTARGAREDDRAGERLAV